MGGSLNLRANLFFGGVIENLSALMQKKVPEQSSQEQRFVRITLWAPI